MDIAQKISEYEKFITDRLQADLKILEGKLSVANFELLDWHQLKNSISAIDQNCPGGFKAMLDIGCNIFTEAKVHDPSVIHVDIGLGYFLTMTLAEAGKFADARINLRNKEVEHITSRIIEVKAHIKMVLLGLNELQKLGPTEASP